LIAPAEQGSIRVLVDHYHDSGWRTARHDLEGGPLRVTICRRRLTWATLRRCQVAIVEASTPVRFTAAELRALERFVREGGGLLLAAAAPAFELLCDAPTKDMPANAIAERFGFRLLSPTQARGEVRHDREFHLGYPEEAIEVAGNAPRDFGPQPPGARTWAPIAAPRGARAVLRHAATREPVAATARAGAGRVCVLGARLGHMNLLAHLQPLIRWLAGDAAERTGDDVPAEVGPPPQLRTVRRLQLVCDAPMADEAPAAADLALRVDDFMRGLLGECWELPRRIEVLRGSVRLDVWESAAFVSLAGAPWARAWQAAFTLGFAGLRREYPARLLTSLFPEFTLLRHLALRFVEKEGFVEAADRLRATRAAQIEAADPDRTQTDLARIYAATQRWHPKGAWLLGELERRFGEDFLARLFALMPRRRDAEKLPARFASDADKAAYYLSLAAGEDLTGWLREIGTTVHALPLVRADEDGFAAAMRTALVEGATTGPPSRRMDALADLAALKPDERAQLPASVRAAVELFARAEASDARAPEELRALMVGDDPFAAIAALQLVALGDEAAADRLLELMPDDDLRFRLMAGHALSKHGREVPELALAGLSVDGRCVGEVDVVRRDTLDIHAKIEGYEVANVDSESRLARFPHGQAATVFYVYWVHTSPHWRRAGLSRLLFATAMAHPEAQRCSCFALSTGTRNNAHAMYRDFGFVDTTDDEFAEKSLALGVPCVPPEGVSIRAMQDADREPVRRFVREYHAGALSVWGLSAPALDDGERVTLARQDGKLVGVAIGRLESEENARLIEVAVAEDAEQRPETGVALVARLHELLAAKGARRVHAELPSGVDLLSDVLARAGYSRVARGGVEMFGIRDLAQLFTEIRPLFERRLTDAKRTDWRGRLRITGERLGAGLEIDGGEVRVLDAKPGPAQIVVRTTDETITRFVLGRETPLEGYLQRRAEIEPQVNSAVMGLLETLFPQVPIIERWGW